MTDHPKTPDLEAARKQSRLTNNLNDVLKLIGLVMQPGGELQKFENNPHNLGMTPMLALGCFIVKQFEREST